MRKETSIEFSPNHELAIKLFLEGKTLVEVNETLCKKGIAKIFSQKIARESFHVYISMLRKKAWKNIRIGLFWLILGVTVTIISINADSDRMIIAYGAVIWGGLQVTYGCVQVYITGKNNIEETFKKTEI